MATFFIAVMLFSLINRGFCACDLNNIQVGTVRTGREIQGKPEWAVTVINNCTCPQSNIQVHCKGFQTTESVSPAIFRPNGDQCLIKGGGTLAPLDRVKFSYAWDPPFVFFPASSRPFC